MTYERGKIETDENGFTNSDGAVKYISEYLYFGEGKNEEQEPALTAVFKALYKIQNKFDMPNMLMLRALTQATATIIADTDKAFGFDTRESRAETAKVYINAISKALFAYYNHIIENHDDSPDRTIQ